MEGMRSETGAGAPPAGMAPSFGDGPQAAAGPGTGPAMGLAFEAFMNPMELKTARRFVAELAPQDPQEEVHAWHLASAHLLAAQRIGKSRQEGLAQRAEQIEIGLAVRLMTLADRKSAALDRHRAFRLKTADEADLQAAARAFREAEAAKRAAETAELAAWRRRCRDERLRQEEVAQEEQEAQEDQAGQEERAELGEQEGIEVQTAPENIAGPAAAGNGRDGAANGDGREGAPAAPRLSEAEAAAQLAWEQAIEAGRPDPRDDAEAADTGPAAGSTPGTGPGSEPGADSGPMSDAGPLNHRQRRALARREKKAALRAGGGGTGLAAHLFGLPEPFR